ncbi:MAG TPA: response regulator [Vicinamibacterales bacterium]|nr:response regulator [Vicinamibacterales bacterium]
MTQFQERPSAEPTHARPSVEAWATPTVRCVLIPRGQNVDVELRNAEGVPFLRKTAPNRQSAKNEAAVLRLYVGDDRRPRTWRGLKPFVLVVEDDLDNRQAFAEVLRTMGLRVLGVGSGREGAEAARELVPDLILLDFRLRDITGLDVCRELRQTPETADIPIVVVTASPEAIHSTDPQGPDVVLAKPCGPDALMSTARLLLRDLLPAEAVISAL